MDNPRDRALRAMVEGTAELVALLTAEGVVEYVSPSVRLLLGWAPDELVGTNILSLLNDEDLAAAMYAIYGNAAAPADGLMEQEDITTAGEYRLRHKDGRWVTLEVLGNNFLETEGVHGLLVVGRDATTRHRLDEALTALATRPVDREGLESLATLVDDVLRGTTTSLLVDGEWETGDEPVVKAMATGENVVGDGVWALPLRDPAGGAPLGCLVVRSSLHAEPLLGWWAILQRVTELAQLAVMRLRAETALQHAASHDQLTGLLNRGGFLAAVVDGPGAVLLADLDGFKGVNDEHGHVVGDRVLAVAAQRLAACLRPGDLVARFGGDEFAVHLPETDAGAATEIAARIVDALASPIAVLSLDDQLSLADTALYRAKHAGRGQVAVA